MTTDLFCARASEDNLVKLHMQEGKWSRYVPPGTCRSEDRGFKYSSPYYIHFNRAVVPAFIGGRKQFEKKEIIDSAIYSSDRYSCEAVFSRVAKTGPLRDRVPRRLFPYLNDAWLMGHARANLMQPVSKPKNWASLEADWGSARVPLPMATWGL